MSILQDVSGADGNVRVSARGLPCLRCPEDHETRAPYPEFEARLLDAMIDGIPKSRGRMSAQKIAYVCSGCGAALDMTGLAGRSFTLSLQLGSHGLDATVAMPAARCPRCGKEQALGHRTQLLGVVRERLAGAILDLLVQAKITTRRPVPEFQASPYASRAAILLMSLMFVVAFLVLFSLAPPEVESSPVFWVAVAAWGLAALPQFPPDEIPGIRPPGRMGIVGWVLFAAAFILFLAALSIRDVYPITEIGFGVSGVLLSLTVWFLYSFLWAGAVSNCVACSTWRVFLRYQGMWYCNTCGLPHTPGPGDRPRLDARMFGPAQIRQRRRFWAGFLVGSLWLFVGLGAVGAAAALGYPSGLVQGAVVSLTWGTMATMAVAILAYRNHVHASRVPQG